ncbi:hypothetical protein NQD34_000555 [Periophthalmus magnuspinnatus]|nr:hypothetical protein NQD34_000555 [Periophthalmus magnuspinnatus]
MRSRYLLSCVDRLPTINETQELDLDEEDLDSPGVGIDRYKDSIRELSLPPQPCYPLHGPLRGHHHWVTRAAPPCSLVFHCPGTNAANTPIEVSDVSLTVTGRASRYLNQNVMDTLKHSQYSQGSELC